MKEYLFILKRNGNDKNGNALWHVYGAWKRAGDKWTNFATSTLESLEMGRVIKGEYITTNMYRHEIVSHLDRIYKDDKHSFLFL